MKYVTSLVQNVPSPYILKYWIGYLRQLWTDIYEICKTNKTCEINKSFDISHSMQFQLFTYIIFTYITLSWINLYTITGLHRMEKTTE